MARFALIHGGGGSPWDWHLVEPELRARGHETVAVDLPVEDERAGLGAYVDAVVDAVGERHDGLVIVGHSLGGFTAALACARLPAELLVLVAGMIPAPGESVDQWWGATEHRSEPTADHFFHDVAPELAAEAERHARDQTAAAMVEPWPLDAWPDVPTRLLVGRHDRMFPLDFMRRVARERLSIDPDEIDSGHYVPIARPRELAAYLDGCL